MTIHSARNTIDSIANIRGSTANQQAVKRKKIDTPSVKTTIKLNKRVKKLKYGILGYAYPPSIIVGNSANIHAFISIKFPESKVK